MNDTKINVTQVVNIIGEFSKEHPIKATLSGIVLIITLLVGGIQLHDYVANLTFPDQIYLSLWETGKKVPINDFTPEIPPIVPIKANEPVTLRFALTQNNINSPQITSIILTFPSNARVEPISYQGWSWVRNNDAANRYFLNFTSSQVLASGSDYNLPAFNVIFKTVGKLPFSYQIIGNKIKAIHREFVINTELNFNEELTRRQNYWLNEANPSASGSVVTFGNQDANSVTPLSRPNTSFSVIDISTLSPDSESKKK